ncbi:MAG: bacterial Ig-like domain-containing protein [Clostridiales bacterium]|jgi:hypothetical protein|nr:bacterial Ig-like domain-containing protein [Clostridiales bacterium]
MKRILCKALPFLLCLGLYCVSASVWSGENTAGHAFAAVAEALQAAEPIPPLSGEAGLKITGEADRAVQYASVITAGERIEISAAASIIFEIYIVTPAMTFTFCLVDTDGNFYQQAGMARGATEYKTADSLEALNGGSYESHSGGEWHYRAGVIGKIFVEIPVRTGGFYSRANLSGKYIGSGDNVLPAGVDLAEMQGVTLTAYGLVTSTAVASPIDCVVGNAYVRDGALTQVVDIERAVYSPEMSSELLTVNIWTLHSMNNILCTDSLSAQKVTLFALPLIKNGMKTEMTADGALSNLTGYEALELTVDNGAGGAYALDIRIPIYFSPAVSAFASSLDGHLFLVADGQTDVAVSDGGVIPAGFKGSVFVPLSRYGFGAYKGTFINAHRIVAAPASDGVEALIVTADAPTIPIDDTTRLNYNGYEYVITLGDSAAWAGAWFELPEYDMPGFAYYLLDGRKYYPGDRADIVSAVAPELVTFAEISVASCPTKRVYAAGEPLTLIGGKIKVVYSDGAESVIPIGHTLFDISGFDSSKAADELVVTVSRGGLTTSFTVKIEAPAVSETPGGGCGGAAAVIPALAALALTVLLKKKY